MKSLLLALPLCLGAAVAVANPPASPYAGQERRDIKSLSETEIADYLSGQGMGLAKAAELNRYPGPRHVLDLADRLRLTESQRKAIEDVFASMRTQATALGKNIVNEEQTLNRLFAQGGITYQQLKQRVDEIARLQGDLRYAHLRAHLATRGLLTPQQLQQYDTLRGYKHHGGASSPHAH